MCDIYKAHRGFVLKPEMLEGGGSLLSTGKELERLQKGYDGELEIFFRKGGGFIICIPGEFSEEDLLDATFYLTDFLEASPELICQRLAA